MTAIAVGQGPMSYPRATVDYIPKAHSKLPFNYAAIAWDIVDSDLYHHLSGEAVKLYVYLSRHVDLRIKQKTRGERHKFRFTVASDNNTTFYAQASTTLLLRCHCGH